MSGTSEIELAFYARVTKPEGFQQAVDTEDHEQWEYKLPPNEDGTPRGKVRVRATTKNDVTEYVETIKEPNSGSGAVAGNDEHSTIISESYFRAWKRTFGQKGTRKTRYVYISKDVELEIDGQVVKLPEVKYEVDVLFNKAHQRSLWCKIDIEIDNLLAFLEEHHSELGKFDISVKLSSLPFGPEDAFSAVAADEAHQEAIKKFWDSFSFTEDK